MPWREVCWHRWRVGGRGGVPLLGAGQSDLQAAIVGNPIDGARRTLSDNPAGQGGYALFHLRAPGSCAGPA
jgi:hypothetical protein